MIVFIRPRATLALASVLAFVLVTGGCAREAPPPAQDSTAQSTPAPLPPEPVVNHDSTHAGPGETIAHGELIIRVDEARKKLHAQHHGHGVLETRRVPGPWTAPAMNEVSHFALPKSALDVIHPGPGEFVHVMEGRRHGYRNLTIGITYTAPGGAPPMHTHQGEESHVLLEGQKILYALGDEMFVMEGPYIVNIPPMVPHSFQNLDDELAELVVIFPTNVWEYDVLDYFPFTSDKAKQLAAEAKAGNAPTKTAP